jgi:hypothetical protein
MIRTDFVDYLAFFAAEAQDEIQLGWYGLYCTVQYLWEQNDYDSYNNTFLAAIPHK